MGYFFGFSGPNVKILLGERTVVIKYTGHVYSGHVYFIFHLV